MKLKTRITGDCIFITHHGDENGYYYPNKRLSDVDKRMLDLSMRIFHEWMKLKYCHNIIPLNEAMTVIDCGSFVGAFSVAASLNDCHRVLALEPSSSNYNCLVKNIEHYNATNIIQPLNMGMSNTDGHADLNISTIGCECSFMSCDAGSTKTTESVKITRLDTLVNNYNVDIDNTIFKIEAEGLEPEIFEGIGEVYPKYITIDISPERNNSSPKQLIIDRVNNLNLPYIIHHRTDQPFTDRVIILERNY